MLAEIALLAATCAPDIHPITLSAIVKHESAYNQYAIGINRGTRLSSQPTNRAKAIETVRDLIRRGIDFDAGLGQINVRNWKWLGLTPETVFDPCTNLKAAQAVLRDCYVRATDQYAPGQPALMAALSCYNTGNFRNGFTNGYVNKVLASAGVKVPGIAQNQTGKTQPERSQPRQKPKGGRPDGFTGSGAQDGFKQNPRHDGFTEPADQSAPSRSPTDASPAQQPVDSITNDLS